MLNLVLDRRVAGDLETIWTMSTHPDYFSELMPDITRVEQHGSAAVGMTRTVHHNSGQSWQEECIAWAPNSHFTMQINPQHYTLPVSYLCRTMRMQQRKRGIILTVEYQYTPKYGPFGMFIDKYQIRPLLSIFANQLLDSLAKLLRQKKIDANITAATILRDKSPIILTIIPETLMADACKILTDKSVGCLIVLARTGKITGLLSERNIVQAMGAAGAAMMDQPVKNFMSQAVTVSYPEDSLATLTATISEKRLRYLPVVAKEGELLGVISIGDIINARMSELEQESAVMQQYIEGRKWREVAMQIGRSAASDKLA